MPPSPIKDLFIRKLLAIGHYTVDDDGVIRNRRGRIVKQSLMEDGYCRVGLSHEGKVHYVKAHRVVAIAKVPNDDPYGKPLVNHKSGHKAQNNPGNLEWTDDLGNAEHARETGLYVAPVGEACPAAKLTREQIDRIRHLRGTTKLTQAEVGAMFGVGQTTISMIETRNNWRSHAA